MPYILFRWYTLSTRAFLRSSGPNPPWSRHLPTHREQDPPKPKLKGIGGLRLLVGYKQGWVGEIRYERLVVGLLRAMDEDEMFCTCGSHSENELGRLSTRFTVAPNSRCLHSQQLYRPSSGEMIYSGSV